MLLGEQDAVISDELNHASIIDGVRLSKAQRFRYRNNDMDDLETQLKEASGARRRLIATDGVFSMDGYLADLPAICDLAERHDAMVMVDDSHAVGFMGPGGRGTPEHHGVMDRVDILTGTMGKALGGASGGYLSGPKEVVELLRQRSRPYLFSNTIAPAVVGGSLKAIELLTASTELRDRLEENTRFFRSGDGGRRARRAPRRAPDRAGDARRRGARGTDGGDDAREGRLRDRVLLPGGAEGEGADPRAGVGGAHARGPGVRGAGVRGVEGGACR